MDLFKPIPLSTPKAAVIGAVCLVISVYAIYIDEPHTGLFKGGFLGASIILIGAVVWRTLRVALRHVFGNRDA